MSQIRAWLRVLAVACLMVATIGATGASSAVEGTMRTSAPPSLSLVSVTIKPDSSIYIVLSTRLLLTSTDCGNTWFLRTLPERPSSPLLQDRHLHSIRFTADGKTACISG